MSINILSTVFILLLLLNVLTFAVYGRDKHAAKKGTWRISERTLLLLALLGGSPAAWLARHYFHHKTSKRSFVIRFWFVVFIQMVCIIAYLAIHFHPLHP
ncbi:DUF1294 domain-containing protein [Ktedonosporobacter rubrisoli]|uniref:DUF1294 domain-containing protein n=1 Tax=Ktedonosporobacter rubrisoli TaxID=2509675 RepID=A0A4P6JJT7_KTERU|nr:DUF1294 domain-containing protein [Ktedonosporobacter rubrisoli]